jgi:hypothetical protein
MNRGHLALIKGAQVWVIRDRNYEVVSATVVHVEPGADVRLGQDIVQEPINSLNASVRSGSQTGEEVIPT